MTWNEMLMLDHTWERKGEEAGKQTHELHATGSSKVAASPALEGAKLLRGRDQGVAGGQAHAPPPMSDLRHQMWTGSGKVHMRV